MQNRSICAVLVSFHPPKQLLENIETLNSQLGGIVVVDNTPQNRPSVVLDDLECKGSCVVFRNHKNLGVAAALNIGIRHAMSTGFAWVILLDQDSLVSSDFLSTLVSCCHEELQSHAAMFFPRHRDPRLNIYLPVSKSRNGDVFSCMTSGSLIRVDALRKCGWMEEELFIDYVDIEYCLRMRSMGFVLRECAQALLIHSLGHIRRYEVFGKWCATTNHSARRRYYMTRNRLVVLKRYFRREPEWALEDIKGMAKEILKMLLVEQGRLSKLGYVLRGIFDAIFNRLGQRVPL